jgi:hypothetical protein
LFLLQHFQTWDPCPLLLVVHTVHSSPHFLRFTTWICCSAAAYLALPPQVFRLSEASAKIAKLHTVEVLETWEEILDVSENLVYKIPQVMAI